MVELLTVFLWALGYIFIAYLGLFFDNYTQNFFRFTSAAFFLLLLSLAFNKKEFLSSFENMRAILIPAVIVFVFQVFNVYGIVLTTPTIGTLITRLSVIFVDLFSFLLFPEERGTIRDRNFVIGTVIALAGMSGVVLSGSGLFYPSDSSSTYLLGILSLLITSVLWAAYVVSSKVLLRSVDPLSASTSVFLISGALYLPFSVISGGILDVLRVSPSIIFLLILSGILSVGIGNFLNYYAIQRLGASTTSNMQLLVPVVVGVLSVLIFNEPMSREKTIFSFVTLVGCWFILRASRGTRISQIPTAKK
jgi:drug/metabolite transporter (DMT)-like permease